MLSKKQYERVLQNDSLSVPQLRALQALYNFPNHAGTARQLAAVLGYQGLAGANSVIGSTGRYFAQQFGIAPPGGAARRKYWFNLIAAAEKIDIGWLWVMHKSLASALESSGRVDPSVGIELQVEELPAYTKHEEGSRLRVEVNIYERSREARRQCIAHYGAKCTVCGFDFERKYGVLGKGFIHVHHVLPLADIRESYLLDAIRDLRPVCPNCHAMIHSRHPALSLKELKSLLK